MQTKPWYVDLDFIVSAQLDDDAAFDVLAALSEFSAQLSIRPDRKSGSLSLTVDATTAKAAADMAADSLKPVSEFAGNVEIVQLDVMTEEVREAINETPSIPELVGYAEIADMAGVSRQRAREIAQRAGFPVAVVETAAGPLRVKAAVDRWIASWDRSPGRRKAVAV